MLKAGCKIGDSRTGRRGIMHSTPMAITTVVTREETATERVDTISFSVVPTLVPTISRAFMAQGIFILIIFPVIKAR